MEGCGDLVLVLSTIAAAAALWFQWSSARAGKRALAMLRSNSAEREPGLTLEIIGATAALDDVEIRIINPVGSWNLVSGLYLESAGATFPADSRGNEALKVPFVIQANHTVAGHVFFDVRDKNIDDASIVLVDFDERLSRWRLSGR
jgi:hypothetical protein